MKLFWIRLSALLCLTLNWVDSSYAMDSYRYLHVSIETPWLIFIFLMIAIFAPFILMATLAWRFAERKLEKENEQESTVEKAKQ